MILEVSLSLLSPSLWDFYIGRKSLDGDMNLLRAESLIIKFLGVMVQFTFYQVIDEDD